MAFYPLEKLSVLYDGYQRPFRIAGKELLLLHMEGKTFLIENRCPHMDASLTNGTQVSGCLIRCPFHGIEFDLHSGSACGPLASSMAPITRFALVYENNVVGVDL